MSRVDTSALVSLSQIITAAMLLENLTLECWDLLEWCCFILFEVITAFRLMKVDQGDIISGSCNGSWLILVMTKWHGTQDWCLKPLLWSWQASTNVSQSKYISAYWQFILVCHSNDYWVVYVESEGQHRNHNSKLVTEPVRQIQSIEKIIEWIFWAIFVDIYALNRNMTLNDGFILRLILE